MATEIWVNIGSGNGLLPEPMLTDHQWCPVTLILGQFCKRCLNRQSKICLKITYLKFNTKFPGANELNQQWQGPAAFNTLRPRQNGRHFAYDILIWMKMYQFHWSLYPRVQLIIFQHWFRQWLGAGQATSHYLNQWWLIYRHTYASLGLNELIPSGWRILRISTCEMSLKIALSKLLLYLPGV